MKKIGILLTNIGTPDDPSPKAVARYLREFLMDPRVIDLPAPARWSLVNLAIVPRRAKASAEAYSKIWTDQGSPLKVNSVGLCEKLQAALGDDYLVQMGMSYGAPGISQSLENLAQADVSEIRVVPLFPHYAAATVDSTLDAVEKAARNRGITIPRTVLKPFWNRPAFTEVVAAHLRSQLPTDLSPEDHVLFSYHGLPEKHVKKADPTGSHCLKDGTCCDAGPEACYRRQCLATSRAIAQAAGISLKNTSTTFQSRLGKTPWIGPHTDEFFTDAPGKGIKRLWVLSPSFVADCLETLEELGIRGREAFLAAGGESFRLVPAPNTDAAWVHALGEWIQEMGKPLPSVTEWNVVEPTPEKIEEPVLESRPDPVASVSDWMQDTQVTAASAPRSTPRNTPRHTPRKTEGVPRRFLLDGEL